MESIPCPLPEMQTQEDWPPGYRLDWGQTGVVTGHGLSPWCPFRSLGLSRHCPEPWRERVPASAPTGCYFPWRAAAQPVLCQGRALQLPDPPQALDSGQEGLRDPGTADVWEPGGEYGGVTRGAAWCRASLHPLSLSPAAPTMALRGPRPAVILEDREVPPAARNGEPRGLGSQDERAESRLQRRHSDVRVYKEFCDFYAKL